MRLPWEGPVILLHQAHTGTDPAHVYNTATEPVSLRRMGKREPDPFLSAPRVR